MLVQTSGMMSGITVRFELEDLTKPDQRELFVMSFRSLGLDKTLSKATLEEIDRELEKLQAA